MSGCFKEFKGLLSLVVILMLFSEVVFASTTGGGLPFDSWFTKVQHSITGPFATTVSILGLVGAGAALIFGGDMNGFLRSLIFIVLVLCFIVAAENSLMAITGKGAELSAFTHSQGNAHGFA